MGPRGAAWKRPLAVATLLGCGALLTACVTMEPPERPRTASEHREVDEVRVASFDFPESELLAELLAQIFERAGISVDRRFGLGSRELIEPALRQGVVDVVPEYLAAALEFDQLGGVPPPTSAWEAARRLAASLAEDDVTVLPFAPAVDRDAFAMRKDVAESLGVESIRDLRSHASDLRFVAPPECPERPACLPRLESEFGLHFRSFNAVPPGLPIALALESREAEVGLMFSSDPLVGQHGLVLLEDDPDAARPEHVVPIVRDAVLEEYGPRVAADIDRAMAALTTEELVQLNLRVANGTPVIAVAREWLARLEDGTGGTRIHSGP